MYIIYLYVYITIYKRLVWRGRLLCWRARGAVPLSLHCTTAGPFPCSVSSLRRSGPHYLQRRPHLRGIACCRLRDRRGGSRSPRFRRPTTPQHHISTNPTSAQITAGRYTRRSNTSCDVHQCVCQRPLLQRR